ncbi:3-oxoadipate enol-lactonase [Sphingomonas sp. LaA6.9]|uniref:3-oxoadipate enol-lactonase n=1 Tax=Sphingomonas sp. LaA6.9 TaxID=2919914 RepID=UPI001F503F58|nr:3-oxoadipate enol-lactonase [Sphingomonas sp. LaA6.9]MCJ8158719.1 3-oxoadipate enol-lactonase [Sphingomonas sp. LaA6.9]
MTRHFQADDGCAIAFDYRPVEGKPVLLLSASLGTAMALFDPQVEALGSQFSILRYDPRGHGASSVPPGNYSLDRLGRDVIELLDYLEIDRVHFAGVSLGGMTGQWLGYRAPERLDGLILANTSAYMGPPGGWASRIATVLADGMEPMVDPVIERWFTSAFRTSSAPDVERVRSLLLATEARGYAGCCAAIRDMDLREVAALIRARSLVIAGAKDPATPPEHAELLAGRIPEAKLVTLDAAHLSNVEQAATFNDAVASFLTGAS